MKAELFKLEKVARELGGVPVIVADAGLKSRVRALTREVKFLSMQTLAKLAKMRSALRELASIVQSILA